MRLNEAYSILELKNDASPEEVKKQYKKLAKIYHPDINKAPDASEKFKKINEAYEKIQKGEQDDVPMNNWAQNIGFPFNFNNFNFHQSNRIDADDIYKQTNITFAESVLGCDKSISYRRNVKCKVCDGGGEVHENNGCASCNGLGRTIRRNGNIVMTAVCASCKGKIKTKPCTNCREQGFINSEISISVKIPPGIKDKNTLRIHGMGNFAGTGFVGNDEYTVLYLTCNVEQDSDLFIINSDVICKLQLPLLEALSGCKKNVKTIDGQKEITIPSMSKNKDEIVIPNMGVAGQGNQRVILDIIYPDADTCEKIINILKVE